MASTELHDIRTGRGVQTPLEALEHIRDLASEGRWDMIALFVESPRSGFGAALEAARVERTPDRTRDGQTATRALREVLTEALQQYETPRDDLDRPRPSASHAAAHVAWHLTLAGESAEEQGECCPLCAAVRETGEARP